MSIKFFLTALIMFLFFTNKKGNGQLSDNVFLEKTAQNDFIEEKKSKIENEYTEIKELMNSGIGNRVWDDLNRNEKQDSAENGLANVRVILTKPDGTKDSVLTDNSGKYLFQNLIAGTYNLQFRTPPGMKATVSNVSADSLDSDIIGKLVIGIILNNNTIDSTFDAGFHNLCTGTIRGNVWHDVDGMNDGEIDSVGYFQAAVIPIGLRVNLISLFTNLVVKTRLISGFGVFTITDVPQGMYYIQLTRFPGTAAGNPTITTLPLNWSYIGEKLGLGPGRDVLVNGLLNLSIQYECVYNAQFGIKYTTRNCVCMD